MTHAEPIRPFRRLRFAAALVAGCALAGCGETPPQTNAPADRTTPADRDTPADREIWEVNYIQGTRIGYGRTTVHDEIRQGRKVLRVEQVTHLVVVRNGDRTQQEISATSVETPDGKLLEFTSSTGAAQTVGRVNGNQLDLETTSRGKTTKLSVPWSGEYGGPYLMHMSLLDKPLQPGERRTLGVFDPVLVQGVTYEMTARDSEPVELPGGSFELLRIDCVMRMGEGQSMRMAAWCDRTGEILKTQLEAAMAMETFRTSKAVALEETDVGTLDFVTDLAVAVDRPLPGAQDTKRVRYRVHLDGGDPAAVFVSGASQQVRSIDSNTAELTVYALRPGQPGGNPDAPADGSTSEDIRPNNMIQSDDPRIVAMAKEAVGDQRDPWQIAQTLERYVNDSITEVDFSQAFATAAEVAEKPSGDCTEHAVLLTALARACGIPARVAVGLVYMPQSRSFGYHMWTEMYLQDRWIPLDATLARGGIGAAHLKLAHSHLHGASAYTSFLPVIQVIGRLKVEVVEAE
ncbi:MAG: transglutaminase family protein [Pirellulales bacterium]|nr:transglutaminase family protein [Pirellulales bacterium]